MKTILHDQGLGNFVADYYWSSTQAFQDPLKAYVTNFAGGGLITAGKTISTINVRAIRRF